MSPRTYRVFIALLLLLTLLRGVFWVVVTPPWEAPDEPSHASYAEHLVDDPNPLSGQVFTTEAMLKSLEAAQLGEISHNPTYPGVLADSELDRRRAAIEAIDMADRADLTDAIASAGGYPPTFYYLGAATLVAVDGAGGTYLDQIQALRLIGVLCAVVAMWFQIGVLQELLGRGLRALGGALLIALMPMYGFVFASFNPDALMTIWFSAAIWLAVRIDREGARRGNVVPFVAVLAAALLTKPTAYALLPMMALCAVQVWRRSGALTRRRRALLGGAAMLGVVGPIVLFTVLDAPVGAASSIASSGSESLGIDAATLYLAELRESFVFLYQSSFWGNYGWLDASFQNGLYMYFSLLGLVALGGLLRRMIVRRRIPGRWVLVCVPVLALTGILFAIEFTFFASGDGQFIQGRYLFPVMAVLVALYVRGITAVSRREWVGNSLLTGSILLVAAFHVATVFMLVMPRYTA